MTRRSLNRTVLLGALAVAFATTASADPIDLPLDEYLCYQAKESKNPSQGKFKDLGIQVRTKDQFDIARDYSVAKYVNFCNPVTPTPAAGNAAIHLAEYQVKDLKAVPKFVAPLATYNLADRLGMPAVTISKPKSLMVRSSKTDFGSLIKCKTNADCAASARPTDECVNGKVCLAPGQPLPPNPGMPANTADYMCYQVKGTKGPFGLPFAAQDQFAYAESYLMNKITKLCAPTEKVNLPSATIPDGDAFPGHLICYQAKSQKTNGVKFVQHEVGITNMLDSRYLDVTKVTEYCIPALKAIAPAMPMVGTPTTLTATTAQPDGSVCGTITVAGAPGEGVPNRVNPATGETDNALCTAAGVPFPCCEGLESGHCNEDTTITCGGVAIGGGGPTTTLPGPEFVQEAGVARRFGLSCSGPFDTACTISGHPGDKANGVNCTTAGCGFLPPLDTTTPFKICGLIRLSGSASGSLNLLSGDTSITLPAAVDIFAATATTTPNACPRCRTGTATTDAEVFPSGPTSPGVGVCDSDAPADNDGNATADGEAGDTCYVFSGVGLSSDCLAVPALPLPPIPISVSPSTAGASISDPVGHFCPGQGGNPDCTAAGVPNPCCTGMGTGSCTNWNGCFGSANASGPRYADTPGICTGIAVDGIPSGILLTGQNPVQGVIGGLSCLPAVSAGGLSPLINGSLGLPSPIAFTVNNGIEVD